MKAEKENKEITESKPKSSNLTPMLQQYIDIKEKYADYLLFFRMGDFFELFFEDALTASKALDIVLTKRGKKNDGDDIPMCGVPVHAYESYLNKLVRQGFKVAICDQTETPEQAKKRGGYKAIVNREVIRIITPGTVTEENLLESKSSNYLLCAFDTKDKLVLAYSDISTGEFYVRRVKKQNSIAEILKIGASEVILPEHLLEESNFREFFNNNPKLITSFNKGYFESKRAERKIKSFYNIVTLEGVGFFDKAEISAIGGLLEYIEITQIDKKPKLSYPEKRDEKKHLELDLATINNLEIFKNTEGDKKFSLCNSIDNTVTALGSRGLQKLLKNPFAEKSEIERRLDAVEFFNKNLQLSSNLKEILQEFADVERILSRVYLGRANPRDMVSLKNSIFASLNIKSEFFNFGDEKPSNIRNLFENIPTLDELYIILNQALSEEAPYGLNDGGIIKGGFNPKLDSYRNARQSAELEKEALQQKYIEQTGINNLKIKENNVIGMFVEVTANNADKIPSHFIHRQTLATNVRYTTDELREIENELINAKTYSIALEKEIFEELRVKIIAEADRLIQICNIVSELDIFINFALLALANDYVKPTITTDNKVDIKNGRHPVIESFINYNNNRDINEFIPNDLVLNKGDNLWLLTGPNMSGKSTFLRQNALIIIMAHIGCYVPAESAEIGITDRIFSRVGASDNLAKGHSTFMVEMVETATILNNATARSFIILDEIGRGTATFDGVSIAWSVLEYIATNIKACTLFATHYHELTELEKQVPALSCHRTKISEFEGEVIFQHKIEQGAASDSYGIHVAKIAGLPVEVTARADKILSILQARNKGNAIEVITEELPLFSLD